jgi:integrase
MSEAYSSPEPPPSKPAKPHPDFPLRPHALGYWCKTIRGRTHYFGRIEDGPDAALASYLEQKDDLMAGRTPRPEHDALVVKDAVNAFLNSKDRLVASGELTQRTRDEYKVGTDEIVAAFGKRRRVADLGPDDFASLRKRLAFRFGVVRLGNVIQTVRSVFKFCYESDLLDRPMRFGPDFKKPSAKTMRQHKAQQGEKLFTADEIRRMLDAAGVHLRAQILLGVNCGFGMSDCGRLPISALDLDGGWVVFPRVKSGVARRAALWPETVDALRTSLFLRPQPHDPKDARLVFLTAQGRPWDKVDRSGPAVFKVAGLLRRLKIKRPGQGFYVLRHTFRTVADESRD